MFEALGIAGDVIDRYFTGTTSRVGGILWRISRPKTTPSIPELSIRWALATDLTLTCLGGIRCAVRGKNTDTTLRPSTCFRRLRGRQLSCLRNTRSGWTRRIRVSGSCSLMDSPIRISPSLEEVESEESIVRRFKTGAMSYGSISEGSA